jgi:hypothetical protein
MDFMPIFCLLPNIEDYTLQNEHPTNSSSRGKNKNDLATFHNKQWVKGKENGPPMSFQHKPNQRSIPNFPRFDNQNDYHYV